MTNWRRGVLYVGVTADLGRRVWEHREGRGSAFCRRCRLRRLVYTEEFRDIRDAIGREKALKAWGRDWKLQRVEGANPGWEDLAASVHLLR